MQILKISSLILLFVFFASLLIHPIHSINQDIGRHLKSGEIIWEAKSVYKINLFSFTEPEHRFINHHWLSEVAFYGLNSAIGLKGLILFKTAVILLALWLLLASVYSKTGLWPLVLSSLIGFLVFMERTDVRPEIFSYLFLSFFLFVIFRAKYTAISGIVNKKWLYALPFVQVLWTNVHIYFALGPTLLLFLLIDRFFTKREELKVAGYVFLATTVATLLNPNFIKGALAPFNILRHYGYSIVENQNIFFLRDYGISLQSINLFQVSLVVFLISFIVAFHNGRKKIIFELLTAIFMSIMAVKMLRNFGIYALSFIPIVALNLSTLSPLTSSYNASRRVIRKRSSFGRLMSKYFYLVISVLLVFLIWNNINSPKFGLAIPTGAEKAVEFVKTNGIKGLVFNNFDVGSFLIWKMYPVRGKTPAEGGSSADHVFQAGRTSNGTGPEFRVFVDGRPEAYTVEFFEKIYKPMQEDPALWQKYSEQYKVNYVFFAHTDITPWAQKFLADISKNPDWPLIYIDQSVAIFIKRTSENKNLIDKFEIN